MKFSTDCKVFLNLYPFYEVLNICLKMFASFVYSDILFKNDNFENFVLVVDYGLKNLLFPVFREIFLTML